MLALRGLRDSTRDCDTAAPLSAALRGAAHRVAERHDLSAHWLNGDAAAFVPHGVVELVSEPPVLETEKLTVYTATPDAVFVMKLHAARPQDEADLIHLWPMCSFDSPQAAADACNAAYEFLGGVDEHLVTWVEAIAAQAGGP